MKFALYYIANRIQCKLNAKPGSRIMSDSRLFGYTSRLIGQALNVSAKRHNLITSNVANMDTIGYKPKDLDFDKTLKRAMGEKEPDYLDKTHPDHLSPNDEKPFNMSGKNSEDVDIYHLD